MRTRIRGGFSSFIPSCGRRAGKALFVTFALFAGRSVFADLVDTTAHSNELPEAPAGFEIKIVAREPLVRHPCSMAFDAGGRLFVGMGPQYRNPTPETPGDSVVMLTDTNGDGVFDTKKVFATGLNCIQGLAWHGRDLWVANSPDLTIVRDLDGDGVADEYVRVYTDLGNIEHALHGLNWAPDGKLYMSKGNSKGLNDPQQPERVAPKPFRDLWGVPSPAGAPDLPEPRPFRAADYKHTYHDPKDDWGQMGGILRCDDMGKNLEIVARGLRNPWDIAFDSGFNWLGTDNDQNEGDRLFMPFFGAHYGWGHAWSADWTGRNHLPTVPISGPVFEGSGTGIVFSDSPQFPDSYRRIFIVNDWLRKTTFVYRPRWDGALMQPKGGDWEPFLRGTGAMYRPTDCETGPDGALYILGWSPAYGVTMEHGEMVNEGRIFRVTWKESKPATMSPKRERPLPQWNVNELITDFKGPLPVWRIDAQDELVRRGAGVKRELAAALQSGTIDEAQMTWTAWALGRIAPDDAEIETLFSQMLSRETTPLNLRFQALRVLAYRVREFGKVKLLPTGVLDALNDPEPRIRFEAVQAAWRAGQTRNIDALLALAEKETDRLTFYTLWNALGEFMETGALKGLLADPHGGVRRAALLALTSKGALIESEVRPLIKDSDAPTAAVAALWLSKHNGNPLLSFKPEPGEFKGKVTVKISPSLKPADVHFTLDGSTPTRKSPKANGKDSIRFEHTTTVKAILIANGEPVGNVAEATYYKRDANAAPVVSLLQPITTPTVAAQVMPLIAGADVARGEQLFFSPGGAGCFNCHRLNGRGNNFGHDLTGVGSRAELAHLVQSMLEPSAVITEGFNLHLVEANKQSYSGILLEETGETLTLGLANSQRQPIDKKTITKHETAPVSAMPPFGVVLAPQQVADITAWLFAQKAPLVAEAKPEKEKKSKRKKKAAVPPSTPPATSAAAQPQLAGKGFHFEQREDRIVIAHDGRLVGEYVFKDPQVLRPFFANLRAPSGVNVTRPFPPMDSQDNDHSDMHPGLWLGFGDINGVDFWRNAGRVEQVRFVEPPTVKADALSFAVLNRFLDESGAEVCQQTLRVMLSAHPQGWHFRIDTEFFSDTHDFYFGQQEELGLGIRMASALREKGGNGRVLSSNGDRGAKAAWGKEAAWWDYSGTINDRHIGVFAMPLPANPRACWGHTRDYGAMVLNPFPRNPDAKAKKPAVKTVVKQGEKSKMGFDVLVHESDQSFDASNFSKEIYP